MLVNGPHCTTRLLQTLQDAPHLADKGTGGAISGVTSANVRACATGACESDASQAEAAISA